MTTWHQRQPYRRAREAGLPVPSWQHPTKWRVIEERPGGMACGCGTYETAAEAAEAARLAPHRYVLQPLGA